MHYGLKKDGPHAPNGMSQLDSPCPSQWGQMFYQTKFDVTKIGDYGFSGFINLKGEY